MILHLVPQTQRSIVCVVNKKKLFSGLQFPSLLCQVNCPLSLCFYLQRRCKAFASAFFSFHLGSNSQEFLHLHLGRV